MVLEMLQNILEAVQELKNIAFENKDAEELKLKYGGDAGTKMVKHLGRQK